MGCSVAGGCKPSPRPCSPKQAARRRWESPRTFSSMKFKQPSLGTKQAIFLPFLISCTRTHLRIAELGCLASMPLLGSSARQ